MRYFFVGIGGVSMSALAKLLFHKGFAVAGSDATASENTKELSSLGITVYIGHHADNLQNVDYLVINGAITDDNPELLKAQKSGIPIIYREDLLAQISRDYKKVIAIAGCHGKSSTTAMVGEIFNAAGAEPTIHNGVKHNLQIGAKNFFITEACEFRKSFLKLKPTIAIVTNVDEDHLDCYKDLAEIKSCFAKFAAKSDILIKNAEDENSVDLKGKKRTITFGINFGMVHTRNLRALHNGVYSFELVLHKKIFGAYFQNPIIKLSVPGKHNVYNALAAITCALVYGVDIPNIQKAVMNFKGIARRFEQLGTINHTPIILDYAHHPKELETTIQTAKSIYNKFLLIFQPHTYTRTLALWDSFIKVLSKVDNLVLYKTYAARGKVIIGGRALDLSRKLKSKYFANPDTLKRYIKQQAAKFDAIILCGAGDVVSGEFLKDENLTVTLDWQYFNRII